MPPPGTQRKSRTGLLIGLGAAALAVVLLAGGGLFVFVNSGPQYEVHNADEAAGYDHLSVTPGDSPVYTTIAAAVKRGEVEDWHGSATGIYASAPDERILFFGITGDIGDPESFLTAAQPVTTTHTSPIESHGDARQICGTYTLAGVTHNYCAWATEDTAGFIAPEAKAKLGDYAGLNTVTLQMRTDLEKVVEE